MLTLPRFAWASPATVEETLALLEGPRGETLLIAGGTDAVPNLKHRLHEPKRIVHLGRVGELRYVREDAEGLQIGALVTLTQLTRDPIVQRDFPGLAKAASMVAGPQLRNMGTIGGNLCLDTRCTYYNQTFFWREALGFCLKKDGVHCHVVTAGKRCVAAHSSDVAPMLIALGAQVEIANRTGRRRIAVDDFFAADGAKNNVLEPDDLVTLITVPAASRGLVFGYQKLRPRAAIDFPMLSVAFTARRDGGSLGGARLVVSALAAKPRVVSGVDKLLDGVAVDDAVLTAVGQTAYKQCHPQTNVPYDKDYRHEMVPVFVKRAVRDALGVTP
ncbi:MAG: 4-hydroxybenzoyl-CoA reductase subunit beta [Candidatus Eisenbacteria bacterium]|uniref:4-hydroxybenzoyl-CoA reductase subunit beta n=1 Tax=Eiseniibacteriota bacterium TaxID=2212470 RepID=A0A849SIH6_UNCEI|nr:4-hydroxybenzoyl-CoA reductase subunit beta [Candidatus Eisenbacteria bacterium]